MRLRLRWRVDRADGCDRARERPRSRPSRRLAKAARGCAISRLERGSDVSRVRVRVAEAKIDGGPRRPADRREHARPTTAGGSRDTCCRSSANTGSTRSTRGSASRSRRTSCARPRSSARRSPPVPICATANGRRQRPLGPASIRKLIDCLAAILDEAVEDELHRPQPRARPADASEGAQAGADVPRDGRARGAHRRRGRAGRPPRVRARHDERRPQRQRRSGRRALGRGMRPSDIAAELGLVEGDGQLPPRRLGADGPGDLRRPARDRRDARRLGRAGQRAVRHPHPRSPAARGHRRALPHPRRQDRGRRPRGAGQPGPRRRDSSRTSTASGAPAARPSPTPTCSRTCAAAG